MTAEEIQDKKRRDVCADSTVVSNAVLSAVRRKDWPGLRSLSLRPGGFGADRKHAWPFLIHAGQEDRVKLEDDDDSIRAHMRRRRQRRSSSASLNETLNESESKKEKLRASSIESHPDERQIKLDTDRSFVLYGVDDLRNAEMLQTQLNGLITAVFRRHPKLSYFQGFHDIVTVLFLTLDESDQLVCTEKMSLHRLRDAMGKGLEPLLGLLQILRYLLRLVDPEYSALLERNTPLPYFALSNLLTLFSHDVPTLSLIQHVFDFLLSRPPIAVVYLAAAVTLARKDDAFKMEKEGEEGMLHSLLSSIPGLSDGDEQSQADEKIHDIDGNILCEDLVNPVFAEKDYFSESQRHLHGEADKEVTCFKESETQGTELIVEETSTADIVKQNDTEPASSDISPESSIQATSPENSGHPKMDPGPCLQINERSSSTVLGSSVVSDLSSSDFRSSGSSNTATSPSRPVSPQSCASSDHATLPHKLVSLPTLLQHADAIFEQFPPSHPALHVSEIMGPQSVIFTWSEDPNNLMSDAEAEAVLDHPELIVLPFVDPDEAAASKEPDSEDGDTTTTTAASRIRRKLKKRMRKKHFGVRMDKKTVLTGTVVALSVAVAIYSMRAKGNGGVLDVSRSDKTLRKTARVFSGILIGGSERLLETFGW